ncbi:related to CWC22 - involved in mRNA splicing [Cephalotrichum gorgonifer]|uniref:Pre-mRNA-splicing factor CWC22 n=1 Tax=Cephalotrichum gorgonifer TaxID=2041049 RepID=A0AAE8MUI7_9PEZI|nr:related to CWC22 - involved in mRNA splicing [Cephalotrichum gorgonifer]
MASPMADSPRPLRERSPPNESPNDAPPSPPRGPRDQERDDEREHEYEHDRGREPDRKRRRDDGDRDVGRRRNGDGDDDGPRDNRDRGDRYRPGPPSGRRERSPALAAAVSRPRPERVEKPERTEEEKQALLKAEYQKLMDMRSGGTYIPPARLRALQAQIQEDTTDEGARLRQKLHWEALKKSITGIINKVNLGNIKALVPELFEENLIRGRGAFCRAMMRAQASSLSFTPIYAALTAIVNSKIPLVGELLAKRVVVQFRKSFRRDDKKVCIAATTFIAHLVNFQVIHENIALQILQLLLHKPTDDSVEIAVGFMKEIGEFLTDMKPMASRVVFDKFRDVLHEGNIDKRVQYAVEVLFQIRKDNFKDHPAIREELDLLEEDDMITHYVELDGDLDVEDTLNIFKFDKDFEKSEQAYIQLKQEILGQASDGEEDDDEEEEESSEDEEEEEQRALEIKDQTNADLVSLRKTIYLTIQSAISPEEAVHKLMKVNLPPGQEPELPSMIVECCSQATTYQKFFGIIGERFSKINRLWNDLFEQQFATTYDTIHRYETNKLRNVARFFGHLFASDAIGWHCMSNIVMTEDATTSSSRIFVKILFQEIAEELGMTKLAERMKDPLLQPSLEGVFPHDEPRNIRFSINYFTSIGMGVLTEEMREFLQNMPKPALPAPPARDSDSESIPPEKEGRLFALGELQQEPFTQSGP